MKEELADLFFKKFQKDASYFVQAPTRINLIGEHTDYNGGLVLPAAIAYYIYFAIAKTATPVVFVSDENKQEQFAFELDEDIELASLSQWRKYFYGTIKILQEKHTLGGFQLIKLGKAPVGAGVSSSAALCCGFVFALNELFSLGLEKWEMAHIAQRVEQEYVGLNCGIMDQFAILFGEAQACLLLNCSNLEYTTHELNLKTGQFFLANSMVKHNLAESAYNDRVREFAELKGVPNLLKVRNPRYRHVESENKRVEEMVECLVQGDLKRAGAILNEGHFSLKDDYEVTCEETDLLQGFFAEAGALGSRQMGGGFGGCMLVLAKDDMLDELKEKVSTQYYEVFGLKLEYHDITIVDGVKLI